MSQEPEKNSSVEKSRSVTENSGPITISSSALDPVKRGLGLILLLGFCLVILVEKQLENVIVQMMFYLFFGVAALSWVISKVKRILKELDPEN